MPVRRYRPVLRSTLSCQDRKRGSNPRVAVGIFSLVKTHRIPSVSRPSDSRTRSFRIVSLIRGGSAVSVFRFKARRNRISDGFILSCCTCFSCLPGRTQSTSREVPVKSQPGKHNGYGLGGRAPFAQRPYPRPACKHTIPLLERIIMEKKLRTLPFRGKVRIFTIFRL